MAASRSRIPTPDWRAISFKALLTPPRVGSRRQCISGTAATIAATSPCRAAVSETMGVSKCRFSRCASTAMPCSPSEPLSKIASPGCARLAEISIPSATTPTPVVVMNTPSPLPRSTTFVSPVTMGTSAVRAACAIDSTMRFRLARGKPSSKMKLAARYNGRAPDIATSLRVPCTDRQPMSPPGKKRGETT